MPQKNSKSSHPHAQKVKQHQKWIYVGLLLFQLLQPLNCTEISTAILTFYCVTVASLRVLKSCRSNKHFNTQNLMLDTVDVQLVKKHSCDANFCPSCQEWKRLDIWRSKNDFSLLLILFQNWYLTSDKALSKANLQVPVGFYLLLLPYCIVIIV